MPNQPVEALLGVAAEVLHEPEVAAAADDPDPVLPGVAVLDVRQVIRRTEPLVPGLGGAGVEGDVLRPPVATAAPGEDLAAQIRVVREGSVAGHLGPLLGHLVQAAVAGHGGQAVPAPVAAEQVGDLVGVRAPPARVARSRGLGGGRRGRRLGGGGGAPGGDGRPGGRGDRAARLGLGLRLRGAGGRRRRAGRAADDGRHGGGRNRGGRGRARAGGAPVRRQGHGVTAGTVVAARGMKAMEAEFLRLRYIFYYLRLWSDGIRNPGKCHPFDCCTIRCSLYTYYNT